MLWIGTCYELRSIQLMVMKCGLQTNERNIKGFQLSVIVWNCQSIFLSTSSEVLKIKHWYLACMVLVISSFNWHHVVTLTFDLFEGQICCHAGDHNSPNLLIQCKLSKPDPNRTKYFVRFRQDPDYSGWPFREEFLYCSCFDNKVCLLLDTSIHTPLHFSCYM